VDIVFEHIGKATFPQEVGLLKMGGTLVATGATTGYDSTIDLRYLFFKGTNLLGSTQGTKAVDVKAKAFTRSLSLFSHVPKPHFRPRQQRPLC
jgi:NADPH:quinone reductase-like Zn-dependent oxidoreductase